MIRINLANVLYNSAVDSCFESRNVVEPRLVIIAMFMVSSSNFKHLFNSSLFAYYERAKLQIESKII